MRVSIQRTMVLLLFLITSFIVMFVTPVLSRLAHGRVTTLNAMLYYVGDVAVSQMLDVPDYILYE
ncbi:hypothetical protein N7508_006499 [Penicillium antarcticum]|uniref:uncharacterized protein n=1 Tax=Penicillium antarcticum TaxID=416450 RepID=UPI0023903326|nr:uncharacterized protein N7508_006499 [Penicillium antarcticum]KAJ5301636.1 hypothetical protein N7508_006499 [Penicillium antarcticum]